MYLLISSYTGNRKLGKAITRLSNIFESLEKKIESIDFQKGTYDGMVICLVDEDENFLKEIPTKENVYQVTVGISPNLSLLPHDDKNLFSYIYKKIEIVLEKCKMEQSDKEKIKEVLLAWKT